MVAEHGVRETDILERHRLPGPVAGPPVKFQASQGVAERGGRALLPLRHPPENAVDHRLAGVAACRLEQPQCVLEQRLRCLDAARLGVPGGKAVQHMGLPGQVPGAAGGGKRRPACGGLVVPAPAPQQVRAQDPRELPGVAAQPGTGGELDRGQQRRLFAGEPVQRILAGGQFDGERPGARRAYRDRVDERPHRHRGVVSCVQVVVKDPVHRRIGQGRARRAGAPGVSSASVVRARPGGTAARLAAALPMSQHASAAN